MGFSASLLAGALKPAAVCSGVSTYRCCDAAGSPGGEDAEEAQGAEESGGTSLETTSKSKLNRFEEPALE